MPDLPWRQLAPPSHPGELSGLRIAGLPPSVGAYLAVEHGGRRHVLLELPAGDPYRDTSTRGLSVSTQEWSIGGRPPGRFIDLTLLDPALVDTFDAVAEQIAQNAANFPDDPRRGVEEAISKWRRFWGTDAEGLSREAALGLFGEMWFLHRWMPPLTPAKFLAWYGPDSSRHDFQASHIFIEVKTTSKRGPTVHHITNLDQLEDPESGDLYLFSLHVADDALAANSLAGLVAALLVEAQAAGHESLTTFEDRLAEVGYNPAKHALYERRLRVVGEGMFQVGADFPRLTRTGLTLPTAIPDLSYLLVADALTPWRVASRPVEAAALFAGW